MKRINVKPKTNIGRKLSSNSGASILFALFLFLVCAAIGSVVLTAGTAAAGRMSKTAEMDQRFYAVQSAAQLFKDQLDGQSVGIVRTKTTDEWDVYTITTDANGIATTAHDDANSGSETRYDMAWTGTTTSTSVATGQSLLRDAAIELLINSKKWAAASTVSPAQTAWSSRYPAFPKDADDQNTRIWELQVVPSYENSSNSLPELDALKVNVSCTLYSDGTLKLLFTSPAVSGSSDIYKSELILTAIVDEGSIKTKTTESTPVYTAIDDNTTQETVSSKTVATRVSTITWNFASAGIVK